LSKQVNTVSIACVKLSDQAIAAAVDVLRSGQLVAGAAVQAFEEQFASLIGVRYAIAVSSGTAALHLAYLAALQPGDEVLVPGFTHIATASMVHFAGGRPMLCDVDPRTFTLSLEDAAQKIGPKTAALAPVHLFGNACDVDGIRAFARRYKLKVIWDAAQAHGTRYRGADIGRFPDLVTYSFYPTKNVTSGEGGMIVTDDNGLYERCKLLRNHGQSRKYYHESFGFNYRMLEVSAAIGLEQLNQLSTFTQKRRRNALYLDQCFSTLDGIMTPFVEEGAEHSFHQYSILLDLRQFRCSRDEFVAALKSEGVEGAVHYPRALNQQPVFGGQARLPNCEWLSERIMSLPVHPMLSAADLEQVAGAVTKVALQMHR
jgi:perosamine synthetase